MTMYEYLKKMLILAEGIGQIEDVDMGKFLAHSERCDVKGTTFDGKPFELRLTVEDEK
jgi:hypothetical protein